MDMYGVDQQVRIINPATMNNERKVKMDVSLFTEVVCIKRRPKPLPVPMGDLLLWTDAPEWRSSAKYDAGRKLCCITSQFFSLKVIDCYCPAVISR